MATDEVRSSIDTAALAKVLERLEAPGEHYNAYGCSHGPYCSKHPFDDKKYFADLAVVADALRTLAPASEVGDREKAWQVMHAADGCDHSMCGAPAANADRECEASRIAQALATERAAALEKYAKHPESCGLVEYYPGAGPEKCRCTCGLSALLPTSAKGD